MKNKKIGWGILGAGRIAEKMADALHQVEDAEVIAVASKTPEKAKAFAGNNNIPKALSYDEIVSHDEIDVIYVATTHNFHFENAKLALENGKNVLIEKPFTVNALEAENLVKKARDNNLFLMEAIWTRFLPCIKLLKNVIRQGDIGELKQTVITFGNFVLPKYEKRLKDPNLAGGVTLDMGIYPISFLCYMMDEIPGYIKSMARFSDRGIDEIADYLFKFPSGSMGQISASFNLLMRNSALLYGSEGYIEIPDFQHGDRFTVFRHGGTNEILSTREYHEVNDENGFVYQVREVNSCLRNGHKESRIIPLAETVEIMKVMDKMRAEWGLKYPFEE